MRADRRMLFESRLDGSGVIGSVHLDRRLVWLLRLVLAILISWLLYRAIGPDSFSRAFSQTNWHWLPLLYSIAALSILANTRLLQYLLSRRMNIGSLGSVREWVILTIAVTVATFAYVVL